MGQVEDFIAPEAPQESRPEYGFRVLSVEPQSRALDADIEPLFDYIVAVNNADFTPEYGPVAVDVGAPPIDRLWNLLGSSGTTAHLTLYSAKGHTTRTVRVELEPTQTDFGLGLSARWTPTSVADHVWHVLQVSPGSPAADAGLISHSDYIIGAYNGMLEQGGEGLLGKVVSHVATHYPGQGIELYVYNYDYNVVRPVQIVPYTDHNGNHMMGASIGYGLLHRLPAISRSARPGSLAPGSTLYDEDDRAPDFEPAIPPPMPSSTDAKPTENTINPQLVPRHHQPRSKAKNVKATDLDDYFSEQLANSRKVDGAKPHKKGDVAPPPKASSPVKESAPGESAADKEADTEAA